MIMVKNMIGDVGGNTVVTSMRGFLLVPYNQWLDIMDI